jgi:hypothetical protein
VAVWIKTTTQSILDDSSGETPWAKEAYQAQWARSTSLLSQNRHDHHEFDRGSDDSVDDHDECGKDISVTHTHEQNVKRNLLEIFTPESGPIIQYFTKYIACWINT